MADCSFFSPKLSEMVLEEYMAYTTHNRRLNNVTERNNQMAGLEEIEKDIFSDDPERQLEATNFIRNALEIDPPPFKKVIKAGVVPRLIEFLDWKDFPSLQIEAVAILRLYVTASDNAYTDYIVKRNAIPALMTLISAFHPQFHERVLGTLCEIIRDSQQYRDIVLSDQSLELLVLEMQAKHLDHVLPTAVEALYLLCTGYSPLNSQRSSTVFQVLPQLLHLGNTEDVIHNACHILRQLSEAVVGVQQNEYMIDTCRNLTEMLKHTTPAIILNDALQTIEGVLSGGFQRSGRQGLDPELAQNEYLCACLIQSMCQPNILRRVEIILASCLNDDISTSCCRIVGHMIMGNRQRIQVVIDNGIIEVMYHVFRCSKADDLKYEIVKVILTAIKYALLQDLRSLPSMIEPLCELSDHPIIGIDCLRSLQRLVIESRAEDDDGYSALPITILYGDEHDKLGKICADPNSGESRAIAQWILDADF